MDGLDSMQKKLCTLSRDIEILRKNQKEMIEIKKHCNRNEECFL